MISHQDKKPKQANRIGKRGLSMPLALHNIETNRNHHLTGPFLPGTPISSRSPTPTASQFTPIDDFYQSKGLWNDFKTLRWMRVPSSSFKMLMIPAMLYIVLHLLGAQSNPFEPMLFISHLISTSSPDDPRYAKGWLDIVFILYYIIVFSFIRQFTLFNFIHPIARRLGIRKQAKLDRFGEQAYSMLYYGVMGFWGLYIMRSLPTWYYRTEYFWIDYPHWEMKPLLKRYYLMHFSYWIQQLLVLLLKIEKPRKDFQEFAIHHVVTLWLIGWSYGINLTPIGNAVFVSMDIPDTVLSFSKLCNYLELSKTKVITFSVFFCIWTYFRHWLNLVMLHSVWTEFDLIPASARFFHPPDGVWMVWWMKYQIFVPILLLQCLNLFWYFLIWRILLRALFRKEEVTDVRSDDEDENENENEIENEKDE